MWFRKKTIKQNLMKTMKLFENNEEIANMMENLNKKQSKNNVNVQE